MVKRKSARGAKIFDKLLISRKCFCMWRARLDCAPPLAYNRDMRDAVLQRLIDTIGLRELSRRLRMSPNSLIKWRKVPAHRLIQLEEVTGVPRETLRPDLYRKPAGRRRILSAFAA